MSANEDRNLGVLALLADPKPMQALLIALREEGLAVDAVDDLPTARTSFFRSGGHDCLIIGPDVRPGLAQQVARSLSSVEPELAVATFGPDLSDRSAIRTARLGGFHPGSRAGQGALLRFLHAL